MLIERWDLFPISCSFSLPSTHSHYCIVVPCFYFFRFSTEKSTFSPHPIQMLFLTFICTFVAHFSSCYIPTGLCAGVKRGGAVCLHEICCCRKERQRRPMEERNSLGRRGRGSVLCTLVQLETLTLPLGVRMCLRGRCVWSSMDWQPGRDSVFFVAGMDMHRITDSLSLNGEVMCCISLDIPTNAASLYKQGTFPSGD